MRRGISLANKCLLVFGGAIVLIVAVALFLPLLRMNALVDAGQHQQSRELLALWARAAAAGVADPQSVLGYRVRRLTPEEARESSDPFIRRAMRRIDSGANEVELATWKGLARVYRAALAERRPGDAGKRGEVRAVLALERAPVSAARLLLVNVLYLFAAGVIVLALAVLVFYLVTNRLILSPVRSLRATTERVREGDLSSRSDVATGDEFQELAETFNLMLGEVQRSQDQLRAINSAMDLKLNELAQSNVALFESAKLKGEFVASISHELRTPLNSIIGFAELLLEIAQAELAAGDDSTRLNKRIRYLDNIVRAARELLGLINTLLDMAKIEAGRMELHIEKASLREVCEAMLGLIHPLADRKKLLVRLEVADDLPPIETDVRKFQQIIFNFLSNAVKFTPAQTGEGKGEVVLRAERLRSDSGEGDRVRVSVIDNGPGISAEDQKRLFEKFQQLDAGHTREHAGTGLGLAICKELAGLLQGDIQVVSELGRGSMFSLILPLGFDHERSAEQRLEATFRGTLTGRRGWG